MEVDQVDEKIDEVSFETLEQLKFLSKSSFRNSMDELYQLEKKYRVAGDAISIGRILVAIVQIYYEAENFDELNEAVVTFAMKKHLQSEQAIGEMIRECCRIVDELELKNSVQRGKLLETLKFTTNGKLYSEIERAKICKELSIIRKTEGDLEKAISVLEDLKIDTITTIDKKERVEIILQLMEMLVDVKDFVKCLIVAKKINKKYLDSTPELEEQKLKFYKLMIIIDQYENYLNTSRHYQSMLNTEKVQQNIDERKKVLSLAVTYCVLSTFDNEKSDMMERLVKQQFIDEIPQLKSFLIEFKTSELINWYEMKSRYKEDLTRLGIFDVSTSEGLKYWKDLRTSTIEHNIKVFSKYYERAYLSHISEFLDINVDETEKHICNLIVNKSIKAKIDRPSGIVTFCHKKNLSVHQKPTEIRRDESLNDWLDQITVLMNKIENTTHLINKEMQL